MKKIGMPSILAVMILCLGLITPAYAGNGGGGGNGSGDGSGNGGTGSADGTGYGSGSDAGAGNSGSGDNGGYGPGQVVEAGGGGFGNQQAEIAVAYGRYHRVGSPAGSVNNVELFPVKVFPYLPDYRG